MSKIALITGITGQDGSYLAELLISKRYEVHGFVRDNFSLKYKKSYWRILNILNKIKLHKIDINNLRNIKKTVFKIKPDEVYHLAAQAIDGHSFKNEFYTFNVNLNYTHKLLSSSFLANKKAKFFFAGSSEMYNRKYLKKINEKTPFDPKSAYGISKVACFYLVKNYREHYNFHASTGILFNHESPRKDKRFVLRKISSTAAKIYYGMANSIKLGDIEAKRDWGHAKDYVKAMWLINQNKTPSDYIIGTGKLHSVKDFVAKAFKYIGLNFRRYIKVDKKLIRKKDSKARIADPKKLKKNLRWKIEYNFEDLVTDMVKNDLKKLKK